MPILLTASTFEVTVDAISSLNTRRGASQQLAYSVGEHFCLSLGNTGSTSFLERNIFKRRNRSRI